MFMEAILSYFGTYTPAADGAVASFKFEYLTTLASRPSLSLQPRDRCTFCASAQVCNPRSCCVRSHLSIIVSVIKRRRNYRHLL